VATGKKSKDLTDARKKSERGCVFPSGPVWRFPCKKIGGKKIQGKGKKLKKGKRGKPMVLAGVGLS